MVQFKGTTQACVAHFARVHKINKIKSREYGVRNAIARLLGVNDRTAYKWFGKLIMPGGENLIRLRYFLELNGCEPAESANLSPTMRALVEQVSLRVLSPLSVGECLKITTHGVIDMMIRRPDISKQREDQIVELLETNCQKAIDRLEEWKQTMKALGLGTEPVGGEKTNNFVSLKDVAASVLSTMTVQLGLVEKILTCPGQGALVDGDRARAIEIIIRFMKVFDISPAFLERLKNPSPVTRDDEIFGALNEFANQASRKGK